MKYLNLVLPQNVWDHWKKIENHSELNFRSDIRDPLPENLTWHLAEIEEKDLNQLFIISSSDWTDISGGTFRVIDIVNRFNLPSDNLDTQRITKDIRKKIEFLKCGNELDTKLISVTNSPNLSGPFTLIEGNRRSIALSLLNTIVGCQIFLGVSPEIINYNWAKKSFSI